MSMDVEKLLRQDGIRPEELLTDGPNNQINLGIQGEETTVGNTKGKTTKGKKTRTIRIRRTMIITNHARVLRLFFPFIVFGVSVLFLVQSFIAAAILVVPIPSDTTNE
uniref:Uncharacterized protein n=1 Tax=Caenorhabditis tropicalis TaxID=1561998 RepID=A0A1I7V1P4_9PELO